MRHIECAHEAWVLLLNASDEQELRFHGDSPEAIVIHTLLLCLLLLRAPLAHSSCTLLDTLLLRQWHVLFTRRSVPTCSTWHS